LAIFYIAFVPLMMKFTNVDNANAALIHD